MGFLPWKIPVAFPGESQLRQSRDPIYGSCWVFYLTWTTGSLTCAQMENACDCTRGCTNTVRESALKVDSGRKIPCHPVESNLRRRRAGPMLYQLSYIPIQIFHFIYENDDYISSIFRLSKRTRHCYRTSSYAIGKLEPVSSICIIIHRPNYIPTMDM